MTPVGTTSSRLGLRFPALPPAALAQANGEKGQGVSLANVLMGEAPSGAGG